MYLYVPLIGVIMCVKDPFAHLRLDIDKVPKASQDGVADVEAVLKSSCMLSQRHVSQVLICLLPVIPSGEGIVDHHQEEDREQLESRDFCSMNSGTRDVAAGRPRCNLFMAGRFLKVWSVALGFLAWQILRCGWPLSKLLSYSSKH